MSMSQTPRNIRQIQRKVAQQCGVKYYDNGIPCEHNHQPIIRLTSTGVCYHCTLLRQQEREKKKAEKDKYKPKYYPILRKRDGSIEILGPFSRKIVAARHLRRRYEHEWGEPYPHQKQADSDDLAGED